MLTGSVALDVFFGLSSPSTDVIDCGLGFETSISSSSGESLPSVFGDRSVTICKGGVKLSARGKSGGCGAEDLTGMEIL